MEQTADNDGNTPKNELVVYSFVQYHPRMTCVSCAMCKFEERTANQERFQWPWHPLYPRMTGILATSYDAIEESRLKAVSYNLYSRLRSQPVLYMTWCCRCEDEWGTFDQPLCELIGKTEGRATRQRLPALTWSSSIVARMSVFRSLDTWLQRDQTMWVYTS